MAALSPEPAGFGRCSVCAYRDTGTPRICSDCAQATMEGLASSRCGVCDLPFRDGETACRNPVCHFDNSFFGRNHAIAMRSGVLQQAISRYKYDGKTGWGQIFARVLVGFLEARRDEFGEFQLIVASPSFTGAGAARTWDHTRLVLEHAHNLSDGDWPFDLQDPAAIIKMAATPPMVGKTWKQRHEIATGPLRDALAVPDPARTEGQTILVYDDVFTDGLTLNEVARCLRLDGRAQRVVGVTLARQPWRGG